MNKLTPKQKIFCDEYLIDLNATRAYKKAYPNVKNDETANAAASRMLRNVKVKEYINKRIKDREKRTEITQDMVLKELAAIAFSNGADFAKVTDDNMVRIVPTDELPEDKKKAISAIKETKFGINIETCDKVKALELIGKHLGMFKDKVELSGNVNNPYEGLTTEQLLKIAGADDG